MQNKIRVTFNYLRHRNVTRFKTGTALERYQQKGLDRLLKHLKIKSSYYKKLLNKGGGLASLPIMDKQTMMEHFDELVCVDITKDEAFRMAIESDID